MARTTKSKLDAPRDEDDARTMSAFEPISEEERALRKALMERMFARRNAQEPLDIPAVQLIHEARAEAYDRAEE